ncbi:MAG: hypothetical protein K9W45_08655 [Candidatus Heimdallarchaeum aukensis]|uniref:Uncharacterized protein n=1 Tax=Candidatus Heimdallarchaeum aukensis TaxID=2876573 RepID=A0A9Y1FKJ1_9ARCH|nr:MAG: hypothetical protein K9W45_08655 [Candidatus Heimdallarchaeum aukensis]
MEKEKEKEHTTRCCKNKVEARKKKKSNKKVAVGEQKVGSPPREKREKGEKKRKRNKRKRWKKIEEIKKS